MRITATSDCHGMLDKAKAFPEADVLIVAGDYAPNFSGGETEDARQQLEWIRSFFIPFLKSLPYKKIIVISGNHEWVHYEAETKYFVRKAYQDNSIYYLEDESVAIDGLKFYGSPWQPWFYDWAFNLKRTDPMVGYPHAQAIWKKIPDDTDVLITHGPPLDILDKTIRGDRVGCPVLRDRVFDVAPKLHVFGHIHWSYGNIKIKDTQFANVALCDENYEPVNPIQVFEVAKPSLECPSCHGNSPRGCNYCNSGGL